MESVSQVCSENCEMTMAVVIVPAGGEGSMCGVGHVVKASHSCSSPAGKVTPALSGLVFYPLSFFWVEGDKSPWQLPGMEVDNLSFCGPCG